PTVPPPRAQNPSNEHRVTITRVTDGDTVNVHLLDGPVVEANGIGSYEAVRLTGIDAPESDQAFGADSTRHLSELVAGKNIMLVECRSNRSYGRLLCKIVVDGKDVDLDQVKAGLAWHYKEYQREQSPADRSAYAAAECEAMKAKRGLWSDPHPMQPQDYRHGTV